MYNLTRMYVEPYAYCMRNLTRMYVKPYAYVCETLCVCMHNFARTNALSFRYG